MERENSYLTEKQIATLKDCLLSEKEKIINKQAADDSFCLDKNELSDVVDEASVNIQTSQALRFRNREVFYLKKINKALDLVSKGVYGLCDDCGVDIGYERMMARLTAELCINCKEERESEENNNFFQKRSKSLGKTLQEIGRKV